MADLLARFKLVDEMSDKLNQMADSGLRMTEQWESAGDAANSAFDDVQNSVVTAASSIDGVATSIENYSAVANDAAGTTDYWTEAVGNYNKNLLESIYSTEELVEMGYKSAEALQEEQSVMELCELASSDLSKAIEDSADAHNELSAAMEAAGKTAEELAESDKVSEQAKEALKEATENAERAFEELETAQHAAQTAMEEYTSIAESGTATIGELEAAALNAGAAADTLTEANAKAAGATEELSKATETASKESEQAQKSGIDAANGIASALAAAGITATVKETADAVYGLATAFSDAESTVVLATGATGETLDGLTQSMMNAYAVSKTGNLSDTASAVGEINTRLGYTGEALEETTEMFLDFAAVTGGNAASSVRSVTQLMNQWNIDASEMESVLSKLTYAGQASGISVDSLSSQLINNKAILDQLGFSLDEATALFMNFELAGTQTSTVMTGFRSALTSGAITSLDELYDVLEQAQAGLLSTEEAADIFGSRAGAAILNAAQTGTFNIDELVSSLENADGTLATTANAAQTLDEKWEQASNNIGAAFTSAVEPTLSSLSSGFADVANSFGTFLNEHPIVTKALVVLGVAIGSVAVAFGVISAATVVYNAAMAISTAFTAAFGVTLSAAIWPITLIVAGIAAVVAIAAALIDVFSGAEDETEGMTASTRAQYYELQDLNAEYERACEQYGENSEEALRLKYQVDDLSAAFENNRQTIEELQTEVTDLCDSVSTVTDEFNSAISEINANETGALALIQKYEDLSSQATLTAADEKALAAVTAQLAESYPELAAQVESATLNTEEYVEALKRACEQEAEAQKQQKAQETYIEGLQKRAELEDEIAKITEQINLEQARMDDMSDWDHFWSVGEWDDLESYQAMLDQLNAAYAENEATLANIEAGWEVIAEAEEEAASQALTYEEAAAFAYQSVQEEIEALCEAYDEAYQAALESFEGQFSLFDEAEADMEATVDAAQNALDSQLAYWENYTSNIETLKNTSAEDLGITQENYEALMAYVQDGSEEAAGLAASMTEALNSGNTEAVASLAETLGEVQAKQQEAADLTAEWQTNFTEQLSQLESDMSSTVDQMLDDMRIDEETAAAAKDAITAYADQIRAGKGGAVAAAQSVASAVSAALSNTTTTAHYSTYGEYKAASYMNGTGYAKGTTNSDSVFIAGEQGHELIVPAHANGTLNGESFYMAGENGPELIINEPGSTVFPTSETDRLIEALNDDENAPGAILNNYSNTVRITDAVSSSETPAGAVEQVKRVLLEIAGSGAIEVNGNSGMDKDTVLAILYDHLKPVLMSIIQNEIYEEGDLAYDY